MAGREAGAGCEECSFLLLGRNPPIWTMIRPTDHRPGGRIRLTSSRWADPAPSSLLGPVVQVGGSGSRCGERMNDYLRDLVFAGTMIDSMFEFSRAFEPFQRTSEDTFSQMGDPDPGKD